MDSAAAATTVHPRAGGELLSVGGALLLPERFIPARAGNSELQLLHGHLFNGSSPRGRGTHHIALLIQPFLRFIPARAGNSDGRIPSSRATPVHPRAGGELATAATAAG